MKHVAAVILLGAGAALATHWTWYRLHRPAPESEHGAQLAWMKTELQLSDAQYARIAALYQASSPRLQALSSEVVRMREAYAAFERTRVRTDQVDFLAFAAFVRHQRELDRDCTSLLHELVRETSGVMTPAQRARYGRLVGPVLEAQKSVAD